jgi:hypothetical protein
MKKLHLTFITIFFVLFSWSAQTLAADNKTHKPFIHAGTEQGSMDSVENTVKNKLAQAGFEIAGEYSPYPDAHIIVVTNKEMLESAAKSRLGAFGAAQRVTLTKVGDKIQVSYTNPVYVSHVYRMKDDMAGVKAALARALGAGSEYGPEDGLTPEDLRKYHYKWLMPYFTDTLDLASYGSQKAALNKINAIFKQNKTGVTKVYEISVPGKEETVIGVALSGANDNECSGDQYIMSRIDFKELKSTGHLPYEVVVSGGKVYALPAEFRIAINFPDLSMMGSNSFASIMCAPDSIKSALAAATGGSIEE